MKKIMFNDKYFLTQSVLRGYKTQTRRIVKNPGKWHGMECFGFSVNRSPDGSVSDISMLGADGGTIEDSRGNLGLILPSYSVGEEVAIAQSYRDAGIVGMEGDAGWGNKMFVSSALMPHSIRIRGVRVERMQDISHADCIREGVARAYDTDKDAIEFGFRGLGFHNRPEKAFAELIDKLGGSGTWDGNPYVFVYDFELVG